LKKKEGNGKPSAKKEDIEGRITGCILVDWGHTKQTLHSSKIPGGRISFGRGKGGIWDKKTQVGERPAILLC